MDITVRRYAALLLVLGFSAIALGAVPLVPALADRKTPALAELTERGARGVSDARMFAQANQENDGTMTAGNLGAAQTPQEIRSGRLRDEIKRIVDREAAEKVEKSVERGAPVRDPGFVAPTSVPPTFDERMEREKERAIHLFNVQESIELNRELRDLLQDR
jgi:hypothetical protein